MQSQRDLGEGSAASKLTQLETKETGGACPLGHSWVTGGPKGRPTGVFRDSRLLEHVLTLLTLQPALAEPGRGNPVPRRAEPGSHEQPQLSLRRVLRQGHVAPSLSSL